MEEIIFNIKTGETTVKPYTKAEEKEALEVAAEVAKMQEAQKAIESKKQEVLDKLGLTVEEATALLA